jgi:predicted Rossmann fold nucleotide-binding protein DprA/Smf involved in DNA uptake
MTMTEGLSADTQAVLLLCSRLGQSEGSGVKPLTLKQYGALTRWPRGRSMRPADLLEKSGRARLAEFQAPEVASESVAQLLDRGAALGIMAERWAGRGLWALSRSDDIYPGRLKSYLGQAAPPLLFGAGDATLLQAGGLAVVGSRDASVEDIEFARSVAAACASQEIPVISGGARGVDLEAMAAGFEAGGKAVGVLADSLARNTVSARYREGLVSGRLVLISPYDPDAHWLVFAAMQRNKVIYALSDAALVVSSAAENGGTWAGAAEALDAARITVYVRAHGSVKGGNRKLLARGGRPFPEGPWTDLRSLFTAVAPEPTLFTPAPAPEPSAGSVASENSHIPHEAEPAAPIRPESRPRDAFDVVLPDLPQALAEPGTEKNLEQVLGVVPAQAKAWLKRACDEGHVRKLSRPVRYVAAQHVHPLFNGSERGAEEVQSAPRS